MPGMYHNGIGSIVILQGNDDIITKEKVKVGLKETGMITERDVVSYLDSDRPYHFNRDFEMNEYTTNHNYNSQFSERRN
jgi:hypothetical protein